MAWVEGFDAHPGVNLESTRGKLVRSFLAAHKPTRPCWDAFADLRQTSPLKQSASGRLSASVLMVLCRGTNNWLDQKYSPASGRVAKEEASWKWFGAEGKTKDGGSMER